MLEKRRSTDSFVVKCKNILGIALSSIMIVGLLATACWSFIDWRVEQKQEPLVREIVYLNCLMQSTLTKEQQEAANELFKKVVRIGER